MPLRVHIVGIAGSGKSTLARWISDTRGVPAFDLDPLVYDSTAGERPYAEIVRRIEEMRRVDGWVTEGAYRDPWLRPLLDDATVIVWLDVGFATAAVRMLKRHARAEVSRTNRHPGWGKLVRFLNYNRRTFREQRAETAALLKPYSSKVYHCRASGDVNALKSRLRAL